MKKIVQVLLLLVGLFVGLWIAQDNPDDVAVKLLGFPVGSLSLAVWLVLTFLLGVVVGLLATLPSLWRLRRGLRRHSGSSAAG